MRTVSSIWGIESEVSTLFLLIVDDEAVVRFRRGEPVLLNHF